MKLLALDLGASSGWAVGDKYDPPKSGTLKLPSSKKLGARRDGVRYHALRTHLHGLIGEHKPDVIYYEDPFMHRKNRSGYGSLYAYAAIVRFTCEEGSISLPVRSLSSTMWKARFTGEAHAKKEMVRARCLELNWDWMKSEDEADALGLWWVALHQEEEASKNGSAP